MHQWGVLAILLASCVLPPLVPPLWPVAVNFTMPLFYAKLLKLQTTECRPAKSSDKAEDLPLCTLVSNGQAGSSTCGNPPPFTGEYTSHSSSVSHAR